MLSEFSNKKKKENCNIREKDLESSKLEQKIRKKSVHMQFSFNGNVAEQ